MTSGLRTAGLDNSLSLLGSSCEPQNSENGISITVSQFSQGCYLPKSILGAERKAHWLHPMDRKSEEKKVKDSFTEKEIRFVVIGGGECRGGIG